MVDPTFTGISYFILSLKIIYGGPKLLKIMKENNDLVFSETIECLTSEK